MGSLYGLLGEKLGHSLSPKIHSLIFQKLGNEAYYHLFEVQKQKLQSAVKGLQVLGAKGVNVTIPYKVDILNYLSSISPEAEKIGAVNTICFKDCNAIGYNTDYFGFGIMLDKYAISVKGKKAVILGSGGASRTVLHYLIDKGAADISIITRDKSRQELLYSGFADKKDFEILTYEELEAQQQSRDLIINCTPCGMYPHIECNPISQGLIACFETAVDLIYNPGETLFLRQGREAGLKAVNGLYMLVGQAVAAQELWNGISIGTDIIDFIYNELSLSLNK